MKQLVFSSAVMELLSLWSRSCATIPSYKLKENIQEVASIFSDKIVLQIYDHIAARDKS